MAEYNSGSVSLKSTTWKNYVFATLVVGLLVALSIFLANPEHEVSAVNDDFATSPAQRASDEPVLAKQSSGDATDAVKTGEPRSENLEVTPEASYANHAEEFDALMTTASVDGGEELIRAFDIHGSCAGVPRSQHSFDEWYANNVNVPDIDPDHMRRRAHACQEVPLLSFDTRREILYPLAKRGDIYAQFLLATLHPYAMRDHEKWLRESSAGGYAPAMVLLAQELTSRGPVSYGRPEAHRLLSRAVKAGHPFAASQLVELEETMTFADLRLARSNEPIPIPEWQLEKSGYYLN